MAVPIIQFENTALINFYKFMSNEDEEFKKTRGFCGRFVEMHVYQIRIASSWHFEQGQRCPRVKGLGTIMNANI
jgi:hypothetical protein